VYVIGNLTHLHAVRGLKQARDLRSSDVHPVDYPTVQAVTCMGKQIGDRTAQALSGLSQGRWSAALVPRQILSLKAGMIRRARSEDHPLITEIRNSVTENVLRDPSRVTVEDYKWFEQNPGVWVWEEDGVILGFSAADTRDGSIWALFIDPDHEGRGIGRAPLAKACDVLRQAGHRAATLGTEPGSRADGFYRQAGWKALHIDERGEQILRLDL
jgi:GNAT superfamily N-acetyltransferase